MTERQADALLRSDLRKICAMFRGFGRDSLLLAALAYNVECGKVMKSQMYAKMRSANRKIYSDYVDFKRRNGKIVPSIERRRKWGICSCLHCGTEVRVGVVLFPENK